KQYCTGCHNDRVKSGGFSFQKLDLAHIDQNAEQAEKVITKLRAGMMPPAGLPRPDRQLLNSLAGSMEYAIDLAASKAPNPGRPALHGQNRNKSANSVRDLLNLNIAPEPLLPADDMSHGFDNMAEVLNISPTLMDSYIRAASKVARLAIGDAKMQP